MAILKDLVIWSAAIVLSTLSGAGAFVEIAKNKSPELALSMFPINGYAAEAMAVGQVKASVAGNRGYFPDQVDSRSSSLASQAFLLEPVVPDAVAVIALSHNGDIRDKLMHKAFELSRRQQFVTGWMIFNSGQKDDVTAVLNYYDTFLRTNTATAGVIIPILANTLVNESSVKPLYAILARAPPWAESFWQQVLLTPDAIENAANLRHMLYYSNRDYGSSQDAALINALVEYGHFRKAQELYLLLSLPKKDGNLVQNWNFRFQSEYPPFDWQLYSTGEYGADIGQGILNISAIQNSGGVFARQLVMLPNTELEMKAELAVELQPGANLDVRLTCAENLSNKTKEIFLPFVGRNIIITLNNKNSSCEYYWISITGRSSVNGDGFDNNLKFISLRSNTLSK